jgi:pimeloyl-ACP methyl ester carboxylesterase
MHRLLRELSSSRFVLLVAPILLLLVPGCAPQQSQEVELHATYGDKLAGGGQTVGVVATMGDETIDFGEVAVVQLPALYRNDDDDSLHFLIWFPVGKKFDTSKIVVLVHGFEAPLISLFPLAIETVKQGLPTVMVSLRGFNMNSHLSPGYGLREIDDVEDLIEAYSSLTRQARVTVGLFGTSMGSVVTANVAAEDSSVRGVVMEGGMFEVDAAARKLFTSSDLARYTALKRSYLDPASMTPARALARFRSIPTMLIWGEKDDITSPLDRDKLVAAGRSRLPGLTVRQVAGGGHSLRYGFPLSQDDAIQLNKDIATFLAASLRK